MKLHPQTPVTVRAQFTFRGGPGKFEAGSAKHSSSNPNDKLVTGSQVDDPDAGTTQASYDCSANTTGGSSVFTVAADGDRGQNDVEVSGSTEQIDWDTGEDIVADGVTIDASQAVA